MFFTDDCRVVFSLFYIIKDKYNHFESVLWEYHSRVRVREIFIESIWSLWKLLKLLSQTIHKSIDFDDASWIDLVQAAAEHLVKHDDECIRREIVVLLGILQKLIYSTYLDESFAIFVKVPKVNLELRVVLV